MNKVLGTSFAVLAAVVLAVSPLARAHTDEHLATMKAPHEGQLRMAGPFHLELVVARDDAQDGKRPLTVYVTDHGGAPVSTAGASGKAILLAGGRTLALDLVPAGNNALRAMAVYASTPDLKAVVSVRMANGVEAGTRFAPVAAGPEEVRP